MPISHLYVFFGGRSVYVFCPFLIGLVVVIELYKLFVHFGNWFLVVASFANIFSHSVSCHFILLWFPLLNKTSRLIRSHLFLLLFLLPWEIDLKYWYDLCQFMLFEYSLQGVLCCYVLSHFELFLPVVWECALTLIYIWLSTFPHTTCCWCKVSSPLYLLASFVED